MGHWAACAAPLVSEPEMGRSTTVIPQCVGTDTRWHWEARKGLAGVPEGRRSHCCTCRSQPSTGRNQEESAAATLGTGEHKLLIKTWKDLQICPKCPAFLVWGAQIGRNPSFSPGLESLECLSCYGKPELSHSLHFPCSLGMAEHA